MWAAVVNDDEDDDPASARRWCFGVTASMTGMYRTEERGTGGVSRTGGERLRDEVGADESSEFGVGDNKDNGDGVGGEGDGSVEHWLILAEESEEGFREDLELFLIFFFFPCFNNDFTFRLNMIGRNIFMSRNARNGSNGDRIFPSSAR